MNAYLWYLLYVAAVIAAAVLLVRRTGRRLEACQPDVLEVAWLRGQAGGVLEVIAVCAVLGLAVHYAGA